MGLLKNYYIYKGFVSHYRFYPKIHKFKYRIFSLLINLEEIKNLEKNTTFFSINKFNLFSFYFKDHTEKPYNNPFFWAKAILTNKNLLLSFLIYVLTRKRNMHSLSAFN